MPLPLRRMGLGRWQILREALTNAQPVHTEHASAPSPADLVRKTFSTMYLSHRPTEVETNARSSGLRQEATHLWEGDPKPRRPGGARARASNLQTQLGSATPTDPFRSLGFDLVVSACMHMQ